MNRDLDDERRLLDISRWQREALEPPRLQQLRTREPIDWDEVVALGLAILILVPYIGYLVMTLPV